MLINNSVCTACVQKLVDQPMYTELVEGENGKVNPQDAAAGIKKLLIDVSSKSYCVSCFTATLPASCVALVNVIVCTMKCLLCLLHGYYPLLLSR